MKPILPLFFALIVILSLSSCARNYTYVNEPESTKVVPRKVVLSNQDIDLIIFDARNDQSYSSELAQKIVKHIQKTYPGSRINLRPSDYYFSTAQPDRLTLKVKVLQYAYLERDVNNQTVVVNNLAADAVNSNSLYELRKNEQSYVQPNKLLHARAEIQLNLYDNRYLQHYVNEMSNDSNKIVFSDEVNNFGAQRNMLQNALQGALDKMCLYVDDKLLNR